MIERDDAIRFHEQGTLDAVTRWISSHDEGIAEWLKNVRRAYQADRAGVADGDRSAVLLLNDADPAGPARIGLLDVGGATLEDVTAWSTWQDPEASSRSRGTTEEQTQGNGGKAYMYRLFKGSARIVGVRDGKRNSKGFEGKAGTVERGTPGFVPDAASGREVPIASVEVELRIALEPYGMDPEDLPRRVRKSILSRGAFTLVEGTEPLDFFRGQIDAEELIRRTARHEQSTLALQQVQIYAMHNGVPLEGGKPLLLPEIPPYPELEGPFVYQIPEELPLDDGQVVTTTENGARPKGRLVLLTSREHMPLAYKNLRPRWKMSYRTNHQMIGSKPISDLVPNMPGAAFVYGTIELPTLEPGYVDHGRRRPKDGPLVEAVDLFASEKIKELARGVSQRRSENLDERSLDEVHEENSRLNEFKNRFLTEDGSGEAPTGEGGDPEDDPPPPPPDYGSEADSIELTVPDPVLRVGLGVDLHLKRILAATVKDPAGRTVPACELEWHSADPGVATVDSTGLLVPTAAGRTEVWATASGGEVESPRVPVEVWTVDHVLLTPREIDLPLGRRQQIVAEVTNDQGERATDVYLSWSHDAEDPMIVRIRPSGWVVGNRLGSTLVTAGAGDPDAGGVWARIPVEVSVVRGEEEPERGSGFPRLLLTGRDLDPATDAIREGDPDQPSLWQEVSDFEHNVWWLNLQSAEASFAFRQRAEDATLWRHFHVQKVMDMVTQVLMQDEFTRKGDDERQGYWAEHKLAFDRHQVHTVQQMWSALQDYVVAGGELP
ncbi:MAG TPA: Ig-like domain-containing protein [Solirubrobacterales bacterium]|nr:Ig-like domain-containing protein [Solirubrobacterales bacterium]